VEIWGRRGRVSILALFLPYITEALRPLPPKTPKTKKDMQNAKTPTKIPTRYYAKAKIAFRTYISPLPTRTRIRIYH